MTDWTKRQVGIVNVWKEKGFIGTVVAYTAFGKTYGVAIRAIKEVKPKSLLITVPKIPLKEAWEESLKEHNIKGTVIVVNTLIKNEYNVDMLIVDEAHRYAADTFSKTFDVVKYNKLLCLTASLQRPDKQEWVITKKAPVIADVPLEEGLQKGWVDPFEVIKIPVKLTDKESKDLAEINVRYNKLKDQLGTKGSPLTKAAKYIKYLNLTKWVIGKKTGEIVFVAKLRKIADHLSEENFQITKNQFFDTPDKTHPLYRKAVVAKKFYKAVADRKYLLYMAEDKLRVTLDLLHEYEDKDKFVISQRIEFLKKLSPLVPMDHRMYHSEMKAKDKKASLEWFHDGFGKTLLSVKALLEGINSPKLSIMVLTSYSNSQIDRIQTWGRPIRKYKNKRAVIIYLYVPDSQEETWLNNLLCNEKERNKL